MSFIPLSFLTEFSKPGQAYEKNSFEEPRADGEDVHGLAQALDPGESDPDNRDFSIRDVSVSPTCALGD
jgi:hypothetical protein